MVPPRDRAGTSETLSGFYGNVPLKNFSPMMPDLPCDNPCRGLRGQMPLVNQVVHPFRNVRPPTVLKRGVELLPHSRFSQLAVDVLSPLLVCRTFAGDEPGVG